MRNLEDSLFTAAFHLAIARIRNTVPKDGTIPSYGMSPFSNTSGSKGLLVEVLLLVSSPALAFHASLGDFNAQMFSQSLAVGIVAVPGQGPVGPKIDFNFHGAF